MLLSLEGISRCHLGGKYLKGDAIKEDNSVERGEIKG
jgi:hypothetical protein